MLTFIKLKISYITVLFILSFSTTFAQKSIKYKFLDRREWHFAFLNLCDEAKKEYIAASEKTSDSIIFYFEGFIQGTAFSINTGSKKIYKTIARNSLSDLMYIDNINISKAELSADTSLILNIKSYIPNYPEYSYDYVVTIDNNDSKILNSKSIVIRIDKDNNGDDYIILGYSKVDEVIFNKIYKKCYKKAMKTKRKG